MGNPLYLYEKKFIFGCKMVWISMTNKAISLFKRGTSCGFVKKCSLYSLQRRKLNRQMFKPKQHAPLKQLSRHPPQTWQLLQYHR